MQQSQTAVHPTAQRVELSFDEAALASLVFRWNYHAYGLEKELSSAIFAD